MSPSSPAPVSRILDYISVAANALQDVATASQIPFLGRVCTLTLTIIPMVQNARFQQERYLRIMEKIHHLLCALTSLAIDSDHIQAPKMLEQIAQCASTLQRFDSCLRSQRELGTIKRLFKQGEITAQLDTCEMELRTALGIFTAKQTVRLATTVVELNIDIETRHQELLELISSRSGSFDTVSSIGRSSLNASSGSFSLLPAYPKNFYGRESELEALINILMADPARIAILGPGGMGKTTLAMAALHHPKVTYKYPTRHFVSCESAHTRDTLVAVIGSHLGFDAPRTSESAVLALLSAGQPCLMILDNFEAPWEALEGRAKVETFLALLADIPHVALLLTMRGAERPGKVQWTHPFLRPLMPLDRAAARQTFIEIADEIHDGSEVDQLLDITDNIPLAVQLVAGVAASVGCQETIQRWSLERTALLSAGYDKRSNLEISIMLSLSSPRFQSSSHAVELLSLMSLLSDGISDLELVQSNIPIPDIRNCKTALVRTSLAYVDHTERLKVLAPIREYIHLARPPSSQLVRPLRRYLIDLLKLYLAWWWHASSFVVNLVPRLVSNLGNLHSLLLQGLDSDDSDLRESILGIIMLNDLNMTLDQGLTPLMRRLPDILAGLDDHELHRRFITAAFEARHLYTLPNPELAIDEAIEHFRLIKDPDAEARCFGAIAGYYVECVHDFNKAESFYRLAISVASQGNFDMAKIRPLNGLGLIECRRGNFTRGLQLGREAYRIACASGNIRGELGGIRLRAMCYASLGNSNQCLELLDEGKELIVRAGVQGGRLESQLMNIEAIVYLNKTEYSNARRIQEAILHRTSATLSPITHAHSLMNIADLDIFTGASADVVVRNLEAARTLFRNRQDPGGIAVCDCTHADLRLREGDAMGARAEYLRLFAASQDRDNAIAQHCMAKLADPTEPLHTKMESARWAVVFLAVALRPRIRSVRTVHQAFQRFGDVLAQQGADDAALSILALVLDGFTQMDVHQSRAECMRTIGDVYVRRGDLCRAHELWEAARPLFERSEQKKEVANIDERLKTLRVAQRLEALPKAKLLAPRIPVQESDAEQKAHSITDL